MARTTELPAGLPPDGWFEDPQALIVVPPPSPSETNPPLGPAILARTGARRGVRVGVLDLNVLLLNQFRADQFRGTGSYRTATLGDHGKDRSLVAAAAAWLFNATGLRDQPTLHLPDTADPVAGMHYSVPTIMAALARAESGRQFLCDWLEQALRSRCPRPPAVVGVSLMGPSQVFVGLLTLLTVRRIWPSATTVLGGSHVTLLADDPGSGHPAAPFVDAVLPGHCEDEFIGWVAGIAGLDAAAPVADEPTPFEYLPLFETAHLARYGAETLTLPVQFTRGCAYGRCTFCTYPVVEPVTTPLRAGAARRVIDWLTATYGVTRFSIKDSLFTAPMMRSFAEALLRPPAPPVRWSATTKASRSLIPLVPMLAEAGLATVELGIETIHPATQGLFDKRADPRLMEEVILALAHGGVTVVVNLIFGGPGERLDDAVRQLDWFHRLRAAAPAGRIDCSLNMLEIVRGSPLARRPGPGVALAGVAPWAFSYEWNAPSWRGDFSRLLNSAELANV